MSDSQFYIRKVKLKDWDHALNLARKLSQTPPVKREARNENPQNRKLKPVNWLFRGQADNWPLESSLRRIREAAYLKGAKGCLDAERRVITHFRDNAYLHNPLLAEDVGNFEWAARLQHYGGPTRLLDFSRSFWVAAFFALEIGSLGNAKTPIVWAVEGNALYEALKDRIGENSPLWNELTEELRTDGRVFDDGYYSEKMRASRKICDLSIWGEAYQPKLKNFKWNQNAALCVESGRTDERIVAQSGCFICPLNPEVSAEDCLLWSFPHLLEPIDDPLEYKYGDDLLLEKDNRKGEKKRKVVIIKIHLPIRDASRKLDIRDGLHLLEKMNITRATLFPGLDGLARSLYTHLTR